MHPVPKLAQPANIHGALLTQLREMNEAEVYEALYRDHLTGAYNRRAFEQVTFNSVAIVDMDSLKFLNDTYGHRVGDDFLKKLVKILSHNFSPILVFRLGGDEFAVISKLSPELQARTLRSLQREVEYFSFGTGPTLDTADQKLNQNKAQRELCGQRAKRGEIPPWVGK